MRDRQVCSDHMHYSGDLLCFPEFVTVTSFIGQWVEILEAQGAFVKNSLNVTSEKVSGISLVCAWTVEGGG